MSKLNLSKGLIDLFNSQSDEGFTLIELIIVILILGILSAMALPSTLRQAAKAREVEGKNNIGLLIRAQQVYHFETTTFASTVSDLLNNVNIQGEYFNFPNPTLATNVIVKHQAIAINPTNDLVRNYAGGVYFNNGTFAVAVCESSNVNVAVEVPSVISDPCTNGGKRIK